MMNPKHPIVDTDIWVHLVLSGYYNRVLKNFGGFNFSDAVESEILKWHSNLGSTSNIAKIFETMRSEHKVNVITFESFNDIERLTINHQLREYDLKEAKIAEKNKGEFVSLLYALQLGIERFKTNDRHFFKSVENDIKGIITIINWDDILNSYSNTLKEKEEIRKIIKQKQEKMTKQQPKNQDPRWEKLRALI